MFLVLRLSYLQIVPYVNSAKNHKGAALLIHIFMSSLSNYNSL